MKLFHVRFLVVSFSVVIILLLGKLVYNYDQMTLFNKNVQTMLSSDLPTLSLNQKLLFELSERRSLVRSYLLSGNELDKKKYLTVTMAMGQHFKELLDHPNGQSTDVIAQLIKDNEKMGGLIDEQVFKVYDRGSPLVAQETFREFVRPVSDTLFDKLSTLKDDSEERILSSGNQLLDASHTLLLTVIIVSLMIILIILAIAVINSRFIASAFRKIHKQNYMLGKNAKELENKNSELFQTKEQLKNIFDSMEVAAFSTNLKTMELLQLSPAVETITGVPLEDFFNHVGRWKELVHPEDLPIYEAAREEYTQGLKSDRDYRIIRPDGELRWIHSVITPIFDLDGSHYQITGILNDVTERKLAEDVRNRYEAELTAARDEAILASSVKSQFLAAMSHEMRSPLNAIIGMAEILQNTPITSQQHSYLQSLLRASDSLLQLINQLLDLSKIEEGHLQLEDEPFDLIELVEKTMEIMAINAHSKGLELICDIASAVPHKVTGDPERLRQILINLVSNAIKFTPNGEIGVTVTHQQLENEGGRFVFSIRDTGIGIPADKLESIFNRFTQVDASTTRKYGGTGLGLTISRDLARLMKGDVTVKSVNGIGSTFTLSVPLDIDPASEPFPASFDFLQGLRILVVDDNSTNLFILSKLLTSRGARVSEADHGLTALDKIKDAIDSGDPYRFILLDYHMPDFDGLHVAQKIKEQYQDIKTTILMLSSDNISTTVKQTERLGIERFLVKPIKQMELLTMMKEALEKKQQLYSELLQSQPASQPLLPLRILLVEDNDDNQLIIQTMLGQTPYQLDVASDGAEACEKVKQKTYDLVLMDMQMPVMDGYTATQEIRRWEQATGQTPLTIYALTAHALKEDRQKCLDAGCDAHLTKPITQHTLLQAIYEFSVNHSPSLPQLPSLQPNSNTVNVNAGFQHLIPGYLEKRRSNLITIPQWLAAGDYESIRILGHSLKGSGASYGLERISDIGAELEQAAKDRNADWIRISVQAMREYLAHLEITYV
ncbi:response regulator [Paenibacillus cremeus]|uniref:Circadian input-output histidine kinase CikA n=1 Tax=Paenibacillus cremeus TaxID=2163881 RepID=A0A559K653_9BACL|nr:response regulator [Paenibacillus cremeus]TVY07614.1 response regulator [Paenibacillus cremeus]